MQLDLFTFLQTCASDPQCGFSIGGFGALAEFQDDESIVNSSAAGALEVISARGGMRVERPANQQNALAYETRSENPDSWQHGLSLIGSGERAQMSGRSSLTELYADHDALRPQDRHAILFDLGANLPHIDFCIRSEDRGLIAALRHYAGQSIVVDGHPALDAIVDASPQRVAISKVARIEVFQAIDRHQTPTGPHTHLLPDLLKRRRTHSANIPIPAGSSPLLTVHPEHPLYDTHGRRRAFSGHAFERFEELLSCFGERDYVDQKNRLRAAVRAQRAPASYARAGTRSGRLAERIALRQLSHTGLTESVLEPWRAELGI
jgi:hypothetical protein